MTKTPYQPNNLSPFVNTAVRICWECKSAFPASLAKGIQPVDGLTAYVCPACVQKNAMNSWDKSTAETVVEKLDRNLISAQKAKDTMRQLCKVKILGRTRADVARNICRAIAAQNTATAQK